MAELAKIGTFFQILFALIMNSYRKAETIGSIC